jgi:wyosine [tRNA(Phe)-imidazoG37] synthetase (radical SAM superfamily)
MQTLAKIVSMQANWGTTLELNILGEQKLCSFNCTYCNLGATEHRLNQLKSRAGHPSIAPSAKLVCESLRTEFAKIHDHGPRIDTVLISGNGEPTLHPEFSEIVAEIIKLRDQLNPSAKIHVLTNGAHLNNKKVTHALNSVDERIIKFDTSNPRAFEALNQPLSRITIDEIVSAARKLKDFKVQTMFVANNDEPTGSTGISSMTPSDFEDWIELISLIKPKGVYLQRMIQPGVDKKSSCVSEDELDAIAAKLDRRTGIRALLLN